MRPSRLAFVLVLVLACGREPPPEPIDEAPAAGAWTRIDLWFDRPHGESRRGERQSWQPSRTTAPLGAREVRDLSRVSRWHLKQVPELSAGQIHALEQQAGTRLVTAIELGDEPYFSFIPLAVEAAPCSCRYRVLVRRDGGSVEVLLEHAAEPRLMPPPMPVSVDLAAYTGERVDLLLEIDAEDAGALALWGSPAVYARGAVAPPVRDAPPNVLVLGVDTLRARALGAYGREPSITPAIDALAAESDVWLEAFATFNATNPSFVSIMTGLYGKRHRVYDNATRLADSHRTLAQHFSAAGYATGAVLSARHLPFADLDRGFRDLVASELTFAGELPVEVMMSWIAAQDGPFFGWIHLFDPHTPHTPPRRYALGERPRGLFGLHPVGAWQAFRDLGPRTFVEPELGGEAALYDGEVAYLDRQIDRLLDFLRSRRLHENTIVVFVADHGENLEEHGVLYNHLGLWDTTTHVPLMIRWPGAAPLGRRLPGLVQTLDLFPTLLAAAGLEAPDSDGVDLRSLGERGRRVVFAEHSGGGGAMVRDRDRKVIRLWDVAQIDDELQLYDLRRDPDETRNLAPPADGTAADDLLRVLDRWLRDREGDGGEAVELSAEDEARLRALGY